MSLISKSLKHLSFVLLIGHFLSTESFAQVQIMMEEAPENWFNLDPATNNVPGIGTERAYKELLEGMQSQTVVVAVMDGGVDVSHEDLQGKIWVNEDEIPDNGIDDDGNGYIDDINGWNFIGGKDGKSVEFETLEKTRLYVKYSEKFGDENLTKLSRKEKQELERFEKIKKIYEEERGELEANFEQTFRFYQIFLIADEIIRKHLEKEEYTLEELAKIESDDPRIQQATSVLDYGLSQGYTKEELINGLESDLEMMETELDYHLNPEYNPRDIVGDDYGNSNERYYGNNDVAGPDPSHGTEVAGIIGADRSNSIGMKGIAGNVKIMGIRVVPDGDERDKDVANGIRYAVDNGAQIINMSFGKGYSWDKEVVNDAVKYAWKNGVLLVHAAGNDGADIDEVDNFPNDGINKSGKKKCKSWISVGASTYWGNDESVAPFSNYGQNEVDIFAPGVEIYSTNTGSTYAKVDGTSFAAPVISGMAALIMSYYPTLTAGQVKDIILSSADRSPGMRVIKPGSMDDKVDFEELSSTGGFANVYKALQLAAKTKGKKKIKSSPRA